MAFPSIAVSAFQDMVSGPAAASSLQNWLEMQVLTSFPRTKESETLEVGPACVFEQALRGVLHRQHD